MDAVLTFESATHRYALGDRELVSVTQALTDASLIDARWFTDGAANRGTAVHRAVEQFQATGVVPSDDVVAPFFDAYLTFRMDAGFHLDAAEERVYDPLLGYAGTLDLRGQFQKFGAGVDVVDIKTGSVPSSVGYQTAAYARLVGGAPKRRWSLNLRANGTYRLDQLTKRTDESVFLAALIVAQAKRGWL